MRGSPGKPRPNRRRPHSVVNGCKVCCGCGASKPVSEFHKKDVAQGYPSSYCKACISERRKRGRAQFSWKLTPGAEERFWSKVERGGPDECWTWQRCKDKDGYGFFYLNGKQLGAHRIAWFMAGNGELPEWPNVIDHICKNVACVNVAHMRVVLQEDNCGKFAKPTPHYRNKTKADCSACGSPLSGDNLAIVLVHDRPTRVCLNCYPNRWAFAVVKRGPPAGSKPRKYLEWRGPATAAD